MCCCTDSAVAPNLNTSNLPWYFGTSTCSEARPWAARVFNLCRRSHAFQQFFWQGFVIPWDAVQCSPADSPTKVHDVSADLNSVSRFQSFAISFFQVDLSTFNAQMNSLFSYFGRGGTVFATAITLLSTRLFVTDSIAWQTSKMPTTGVWPSCHMNLFFRPFSSLTRRLWASPDSNGASTNTMPASNDLSSRLDPLHSQIEELMKIAGTAGVSVGAYQPGQSPYYANFGFRDVQNQLPVSEHTIFPICSLTKLFTAISMGTIIDQDDALIEWYTRIKDILPEFAISDDVLREQMTIADCLAHRTGMTAADFYLGSEKQHHNCERRQSPVHQRPSSNFSFATTMGIQQPWLRACRTCHRQSLDA